MDRACPHGSAHLEATARLWALFWHRRSGSWAVLCAPLVHKLRAAQPTASTRDRKLGKWGHALSQTTWMPHRVRPLCSNTSACANDMHRIGQLRRKHHPANCGVPHLARDALGVEGVAAGALPQVHLLGGGFLDHFRARVHTHENAHIKVDAQ